MLSFMRTVGLSCLVLSLASCSFNFVAHDEDAAARVALEFADTLLLKEDVERAYLDAHDALRQAVSHDQWVRVFRGMQALGRPDRLTVTGYETIGPQKAINIYIHGETDQGVMYYKVTLLGEMSSGYKVGGFWANTSQHAKVGSHQQFPTKLIRDRSA